jgi:hypothetical protein
MFSGASSSSGSSNGFTSSSAHRPPRSHLFPFITQLTKQGVLKAEDLSSLFFRVCAEASVEGYHKSIAAREMKKNAFQSLDACSRLIVYIIKYHGDASGVNNDQAKVHYLTKILSIFVLVLASLHEEQGADFQQKPFFRFFLQPDKRLALHGGELRNGVFQSHDCHKVYFALHVRPAFI